MSREPNQKSTFAALVCHAKAPKKIAIHAMNTRSKGQFHLNESRQGPFHEELRDLLLAGVQSAVAERVDSAYIYGLRERIRRTAVALSTTRIPT